MSCPQCQSARSPGGKKHRRRRDLLRSWRSWGEPFQRESARGAAPAEVSQFVLCIPTIGGVDSGEVVKHPTRPGRTGILFEIGSLCTWRCSAQGARRARRQAPCISPQASQSVLPLLEGRIANRCLTRPSTRAERRRQTVFPLAARSQAQPAFRPRAGAEHAIFTRACVRSGRACVLSPSFRFLIFSLIQPQHKGTA